MSRRTANQNITSPKWNRDQMRFFRRMRSLAASGEVLQAAERIARHFAASGQPMRAANALAYLLPPDSAARYESAFRAYLTANKLTVSPLNRASGGYR